MMPGQHNVYGQHHYNTQLDNSFFQQQHQPSSHQQQLHAQQAAATAARVQHYNSIATANNTAHALNVSHAQVPDEGGIPEDNRRTLQYVADLLSENTREAALLELSKKREQVPELALILWHSFGKWQMSCSARGSSGQQLTGLLGVMTSLLQEIISVYTLLNPSQLTAAASNRVCNALALLQCVASHGETRTLFLNGRHISVFDISGSYSRANSTLQRTSPCFCIRSSIPRLSHAHSSISV